MNRVSTEEAELANYAGVVPDDILAEVTRAAGGLKGLRILHINATPAGGGVAEILKSLVPLMRSTGIDADWYAIEPDESFFQVSKLLHHCLQGDRRSLGRDEMELYLAHNQRAAQALDTMGIDADLWIVHDVQLLPLLHYLKTKSPAVWVCHVDTTSPNESVRELLLPYMQEYSKIVASLPQYKLEEPGSDRVLTFPPAIDPLLPKNVPLSSQRARELLAGLGINPMKPIVSQISRFDQWKDPWGVIDAYRLAREEIPGLQLALVGVMTAKDDPDAIEVFTSVQNYAAGDSDIHLFSNPLVVGDLEVSAFQSGSDVILQKSIREGFGLTVAEAMWKRTPVIGGDCGGIRLQISDGENGFLVSDSRTCAQRIVSLLNDQALAGMIGNAGRESVKRSYLMPRLLRDYLELALLLVDGQGPDSTAAERKRLGKPTKPTKSVLPSRTRLTL